MTDAYIQKKVASRFKQMFPKHPNFADDFANGKIHLYDSSLFNNEDENLNKGIYNQGPKFRCLHDNELRMVKEVEKNWNCKVFFVIKYMMDRGLTYWLFHVDPDYPDTEDYNYEKDAQGNIHPNVYVVDVGYQMETLPATYVSSRQLTIGDLEA